jgi:hypothetical protein
MASKADSISRRIDQWQKADTAVLLLNSVSCLLIELLNSDNFCPCWSGPVRRLYETDN